ncbi:hypothetical protein D3C87_1810460 [compost metagenome]
MAEDIERFKNLRHVMKLAQLSRAVTVFTQSIVTVKQMSQNSFQANFFILPKTFVKRFGFLRTETQTVHACIKFQMNAHSRCCDRFKMIYVLPRTHHWSQIMFDDFLCTITIKT